MTKEEVIHAIRDHDLLRSNPTFERFLADVRAALDASFITATVSKDANEVLRATGSMSALRSVEEWYQNDLESLRLQID